MNKKNKRTYIIIMLTLLHKIKVILNIINYYILIFLGLSGTSYIIWIRFLHERAIRDVPDGLFTEFRFWILLYICCIYLFVIRNIIKPKQSHGLLIWFSDLFFTPLIMLDHFFKYNKFAKSYYYKLMYFILTNLKYSSLIRIKIQFLLLDIFPRIILVFILIIDIFYFNTIELFYKIILIGILPFLFRYLLYSLKYIYNHWITALEEKYDIIFVYEKGYEGIIARKRDTLAKFHYEKVSIKEYIEIKYENMIAMLVNDDFPYEYVCSVLAKENVYTTYKKEKYKDLQTELTEEDSEQIIAMFQELMPKILDLKMLLNVLDQIRLSNIIKYSKIFIFGLYFLCWSTVLSLSYYVYPITFNLFNYFCESLTIYLLNINDPFTMCNDYSLRKNLFTLDVMLNIYKQILKVIFKL